MNAKVKSAMQHIFVTSVAGVSLLAPLALSTSQAVQASSRRGISVTRVAKRSKRSKRRNRRRNVKKRQAVKRMTPRELRKAKRAINKPINNQKVIRLGASRGSRHMSKFMKMVTTRPKGKVYHRGANKMIGNRIIVHAHGHTYYIPESAQGTYGHTSIAMFEKCRALISPELIEKVPSNVDYLPYIFGSKRASYGEFKTAHTDRAVWNKYYLPLSFKDFAGKMNVMLNESGGRYGIKDGRFQTIRMPHKYVGYNLVHQMKQEKYELHYLQEKNEKSWAVAGYNECHGTF